MADQDPSAFLRSDKAKGADTPMFDAKKWLWIPDETAGFLAGEIKDQKGDQVTLELTNGQVSLESGSESVATIATKRAKVRCHVCKLEVSFLKRRNKRISF